MKKICILITLVILVAILGFVFSNSSNPSSVAPKISITNVQDGQSFSIGSQQTISWEITGDIRPEYTVALVWEPGEAPVTFTPISATTTSYTFTIPDNIAIGGDAMTPFVPGEYKLHVRLYSSAPCLGYCAPTEAVLLASDQVTLSIKAAPSQSALLRVCPDEKINNRMPGTSPASSYYILNGERREISEFDTNWVNSNCTVPEQTVY